MVHIKFLGLLFMKTELLLEHYLYYNQILHRFGFTIYFFTRMNNKKVPKRVVCSFFGGKYVL